MDYKPKHKKIPGFAGSTPRGPERWARAAANALFRPRSASAKLFMDRLANARAFADQYDAYSVPIGFWDTSWQPTATSKRKYAACGIHCAVMQAQLDWATTKHDEIHKLLEDGYLPREHTNTQGHTFTYREHAEMRPLDRTTLARSVHCIVCGSTIKRKK